MEEVSVARWSCEAADERMSAQTATFRRFPAAGAELMHIYAQDGALMAVALAGGSESNGVQTGGKWLTFTAFAS